MSQAVMSIKPSTSKLVLNAVYVLSASLFIALCAKISVPLFFTPVPLTLQTFAILLVGCMLGSKKGALAVALYLGEAMIGLPVLSGTSAGLFSLFSPTGGYLLGFIAQAYLAGLFFERVQAPSKVLKVIVLSSICMLQLALGTVWLGAFVGWSNALAMGFVPFISGEILKSLAVASIFKK